jgi:uncharacterized protein (TIGR02271 family)
MRLIQTRKCLVGFATALSSLALVTGCHSTRSSEASIYSEPGGGATAGKSAQPSIYSEPAMGATSATASQSTSGSDGSGPAQYTTTLTTGEVSIPLHEEQLLVGTRKVESGSVRLRKQVTTETVNQPVQVRRETLVVDRVETPTGETTSTNQSGTISGILGPFQQGEVLIRLFSEEPVVEKRIVPSSRIVAQTRTNTEQVTVSREIRREKIDVQKTGNGQNITISDKVGQPAHEAIGGTGTGAEQTKGQDQNKSQDQGNDRTPAEKP